jgi:hypothetical protein
MIEDRRRFQQFSLAEVEHMMELLRQRDIGTRTRDMKEFSVHLKRRDDLLKATARLDYQA